jgi:predicted phosphodiesterase
LNSLILPRILLTMKIAIISDIHGNLEALDAVLEAIRKKRVSSIICLGDVVGYGANPNECIKLLRARNAVAVLGNHDDYVIGRRDMGFNQVAAIAAEWTIGVISHVSAEWLASRPRTLDLGDAVAVHASLPEPKAFKYLLDEGALRLHFAAQECPIGLVGHSHIPAASHMLEDLKIQYVMGFELGDKIEVNPSDGTKWVFNCGSVGRPRDLDGSRLARFAIMEGPSHGPYAIQLFGVPYDVDSAAEKILAAGLPTSLAKQLYPRGSKRREEIGK